jgi:hypothetical protein
MSRVRSAIVALGASMLLLACDKHHSDGFWSALDAKAKAPCECAKLGKTVDANHLQFEVVKALMACRAKAESMSVPAETEATLGGKLAREDVEREAALHERHTTCERSWSQALEEVDPHRAP